MRRRSRAGGEPVRTRRRKTVTQKRRNAQKVARRRSSSSAGQETEVAQLTRELKEALERQVALEQRNRETTTQLESEIAVRKHAEHELSQHSLQLDMLVQGIKDHAIYMLDTNGRSSAPQQSSSSDLDTPSATQTVVFFPFPDQQAGGLHSMKGAITWNAGISNRYSPGNPVTIGHRFAFLTPI